MDSAELNYVDSIELGPGVSIIRLNPQYRQRLQDDKVLLSGYQSSLDRLSTRISLQPSISLRDKHFSLNGALSLAIFLSFALRLATGIPFDIPFWFDVSENDNILGIGRTSIRTYRSWPRYQYPIDKGITIRNINHIIPHLPSLVEKYIKLHDSDKIIKAIEFAAIGFQTFHIPTRLINQVMFMEILFSTDIQELSFQLASRISWYLKHSHNPKEREELFKKTKKIYTMRSKIVHGENQKNKEKSYTQMRQMLEQTESINSEIFREILKQNHIELFSTKRRRTFSQS